MTNPLEQKLKKQPTDGMSGQCNFQQPISSCHTLPLNFDDPSFSSCFASGEDAHSKTVTVLSAAATSSLDFHQMPGFLQSGADMLSDISTPLTPSNSADSYLCSPMSGSLSTGGKKPGLKPSPSIPISTSTSINSDYFEAQGTAHSSSTNIGLASDGGSSSMFFIGAETGFVQSQESGGLSSSTCYTAGGQVGKNEGPRPSPTGADDILGSEISSMDTSSSTPSAFFPPSSFFHQSKDFSEAERDPTMSSNDPPSQNIPHVLPLDISWGSVTHAATTSITSVNNSNSTISGTQSKAVISSTDSNIITSHINFPVSFQNQEGGVDFDKFDCPLPSSLNPMCPSTSGFPEGLGGRYGHSSQGGYGGSIVTLGNPADP